MDCSVLTVEQQKQLHSSMVHQHNVQFRLSVNSHPNWCV
uniref:Uncharacterized protein n=1 Tax=Arundo donax TaxID=35708 RepID=A0A0A8ZEV4_ARUDO